MSTWIELGHVNSVNHFVDEEKAMIPVANDALVTEPFKCNLHNSEGSIHLGKAR